MTTVRKMEVFMEFLDSSDTLWQKPFTKLSVKATFEQMETDAVQIQAQLNKLRRSTKHLILGKSLFLPFEHLSR